MSRLKDHSKGNGRDFRLCKATHSAIVVVITMAVMTVNVALWQHEGMGAAESHIYISMHLPSSKHLCWQGPTDASGMGPSRNKV